MNTENLYEGQVFKNYKEMCEVLGLDVLTSNSKYAQFKELERYCDVEKQGHKIYINQIYAKPLDKIETRGNRNGKNITLLTPLTQTNPILAKQWSVLNSNEITDDITRCTLDNYYWECDCCDKTIFTSPLKRLNPNKGITDEAITCHYCSLSKGAKRVYDFLENNDIKFTQEYTFDDLFGTGETKRRLRFDFAILNSDNSLEALIEYDGEYHDLIESTQIHDVIKDDYCMANNIPLLRIHHSEDELIEKKVSDFLNVPLDDETLQIIELIGQKSKIELQIKLLKKQLKLNDEKLKYLLNQ